MHPDSYRSSYALWLLEGELRRDPQNERASRELHDITLRCLDQHHPAFFEKVDVAFFEQLACAGKIFLGDDLREQVAVALAVMSAAEPRARNARLKIRPEVAAAERVIAALGEEDDRLRELLQVWVRREVKRLAVDTPKRVRARLSWATAIGIWELIRIYRRAGGVVSFPHKDRKTYDGPLPRFLTEVWKVLPRSSRRVSAQAFVALACVVSRLSAAQILAPGRTVLSEIELIAGASPLRLHPAMAGTMADFEAGGKNV